MRAGSLREQIVIKRKPTEQELNSLGEDVGELVEFETVRGSYEQLRGEELFEAQKINPKLAARWKIRYLPGLNNEMVIFWGSRRFDIVAVNNFRGRNREMILLCTEGAEI